jgi:cytochrome bd-type quinol oxidase subunit 2
VAGDDRGRAARPRLYRRVFDFSLQVFAVSLGMGVVNGIVMAFLSLGLMFWPSMIPYSVTIADAVAPDASLRFLFYGGVVVLPVIAAYTIGVGVYWVFRGKIGKVASKP